MSRTEIYLPKYFILKVPIYNIRPTEKFYEVILIDIWTDPNQNNRTYFST